MKHAWQSRRTILVLLGVLITGACGMSAAASSETSRTSGTGGTVQGTGASSSGTGGSPPGTGGAADAGMDVLPSCMPMGLGGAAPCAGSSCPKELASWPFPALSIAVDATNVYLAGPHGVASCNINGCAVPHVLYPSGVSSLGVSGPSIFFWSGHLFECPIAGCGTSPVMLGPATQMLPPLYLAVDATNVYLNDGDVWEAPIAAGSAPFTSLYGNPGKKAEGAIAVDATSVYWLDPVARTLLKCAIGGCGGAPTTLATDVFGASTMAVDATSVYWIERDRCNPQNTDLTGSIVKCAIGGCGTPTVLASGQGAQSGIATDGTNVYWTVSRILTIPGAVMKCAVGGCGNSPTVVASGQFGAGAIALDANNIYWTNQTSGGMTTVMKLAK